jgi:hypothetical protein
MIGLDEKGTIVLREKVARGRCHNRKRCSAGTFLMMS